MTLFGLTRQEAALYRCLCGEGSPLTGYEIAKLTGIARSNVYAALSAMTEKGAVYIMTGSPAKYSAVTPHDFCSNYIRMLTEVADKLERELPHTDHAAEGYITLSGRRRIMDTVRSMLRSVEERVYLSADGDFIAEIRSELEALLARRLKVVIITPQPQRCPTGALLYTADCGKGQIRMIADGTCALTGDIAPDDAPCSCLFSRKENLVELLKESLKNQIELITLQDSK